MSTPNPAYVRDTYRSAVERMTPPDRTAHTMFHLTDGFWHDACPACKRRREIGGTGLQEWSPDDRS